MLYVWEPCFVWMYVEIHWNVWICSEDIYMHIICRLAQPTSATQAMNMIVPSIIKINMTLLACCTFLYIFPRMVTSSFDRQEMAATVNPGLETSNSPSKSQENAQV